MNEFNYETLGQWLLERNELLHNINVDKYIKFCKKWDIPHSTDEKVCLASMHKARLGLNGMSKEEIKESKKWLKENGFHPYIEF